MKMSKTSISTFCLTLVAAAAMTMIPEISLADAGDDGGIGSAMCTIVEWFNGSTGKAIATIAIIVLGIAAFFGKVTWGMALMFAIGIFAIFGAANIVNAIASGGDATAGNC
jgi:type IV secretory pathway VirB2 component (pilin)